MILSIIMTAHKEGEVLKKTARSLLDCVEGLECINVDYELVINIDKGDRRTIEAANFFGVEFGFRINHTEYGDVGLARNEAIRKVRGEYVALIDADDVVSSNWLLEGMKTALSCTGKAVVHPEVEMRFNEDGAQSCSVRGEYGDNWSETLALIEGNKWCSVVIGKRKIFLDNPYPSSDNGFGYEDYYFNCSITKCGGRNLIAKNTVVFCRQKSKSVSTITHDNNYILAYHQLFNLRVLQRRMKKNGLPEIVFTKNNEATIPEFVELEIRNMSNKDDEFKKYFSNCSRMEISYTGKDEDVIFGESFCNMISGVNLRFLPKTLVFMNSMKDCGGWREWKIITGEEQGVCKVSSNIIDFHKYFGSVPPGPRNEALTRLIVQSKAKKIVTNSFVSPWLKRHKAFLESSGIDILR